MVVYILLLCAFRLSENKLKNKRKRAGTVRPVNDRSKFHNRNEASPVMQPHQNMPGETPLAPDKSGAGYGDALQSKDKNGAG